MATLQKIDQEPADVLTFGHLVEFFKSRDIVSYYARTAMRKMHADVIKPYAQDVFRFLNHRRIRDPLEQYAQRLEWLRILQNEFDKTGKCRAAISREVPHVDDEQYELALLLSFISTNHRFEILQRLVKFLRMSCSAPNEVLSVGYGTGYELKLVFDELPGWKLWAFDSSPESYESASSLLCFFGYSADCLRQELFPLDNSESIAAYRGRFGKIILCELLEHLENPELALEAARNVISQDGLLFCTMAVNIAQEDHVYLYTSAEQARAQVLGSGFEIVEELVAPVVLPFAESDRTRLFKKGNYICLARAKCLGGLIPIPTPEVMNA